MKFFIFTCLLAVVLAKHEMDQGSSSEESINVSQQKFKQVKKVAIHPSKEDICSTFCEEAVRNIKEVESAEVPTENKISQFYQKWKFLQYLQALHQGQIVMNPWDQGKTRAYPFIPTVNTEQLSISEESTEVPTEENSKKTVDMESTEVFNKKTELTEEEKDHQKFLNKIYQYYQTFLWPEYLKTVYQYQKTMTPWNHIKRYF
nr:alpha-S2-casein isoform X1 [Camelus bactrianus]